MNTGSALAVRPVNFQVSQAAPAVLNCAVFSTGIISTGLAFSLYAIFKGGRHAHNPFNPPPLVQWLAYPTAYVPPMMHLFEDDQVPFGVPPLFSCPKDSEHLERTFDFLRYQHVSRKLGVPSVVNQDTTLVWPLRVLGNASGSFLSAADLLPVSAPSTRGGSQKLNGGLSGSSGGDDYDYRKPGSSVVMSSTRLPLVFGDVQFKGEPISESNWSGISTVSLIVAITVGTLLARRGRSHCQSSTEPSTIVNDVWDVQDAGSSGDNNDNAYPKDSCAPVPPPELDQGVFLNPEHPLEPFEADPLKLDSYKPNAVVEVCDKNSPVRPNTEEASAPVDIAAQFDALQDGQPNHARPSNDLELPIVETPERRKIEPFTGGSEHLNSSMIGNTENGADLDQVVQEAYENTVETLVTPQPVDAHACEGVTELEPKMCQPVETFLAPVSGDNAEGDEYNDSDEWVLVLTRKRGRRGKKKAHVAREGVHANSTQVAESEVAELPVQSSRRPSILHQDESEAEPVQSGSSRPLIVHHDEPLRKRGRRWHGRGRGTRRSPSREADALNVQARH